MSSMYITEPATSGKVCLSTTIGDLDIELWCRECPLACRNFIQLCMEGYYDGCVFHRLLKDFLVQTGDPTGTGHGGESIYGENFKIEHHQRLNFNRRGLVGMAGEAKDGGNGSQFFITLGAADGMNGKHTLFGKVAGETLFNVLELNKYDVDKNDRPSKLHKINKAKILLNPFNDIEPRSEKTSVGRKGGERRDRKRQGEAEAAKIKNTALLSFGDEVDEDAQQTATISKKFKSKSAHDVLEDESLSKEKAVKPEEIGGDREEVDEEDQREALGRIKDKLASKKDDGRRQKRRDYNEDGDDEDFEKAITEQKEAEQKAELEKVTQELKSLQKEYKKAMRPAGEDRRAEEPDDSDAMKSYKHMKLKFKSGSKGIVRSVDPKREAQTMSLLERFQTKLSRASVEGILQDKRVDMSDQRSQQEIIEATSSSPPPLPQGQMDFDAEDLPGDEWMAHALIAPEDTSGVTKARDANMKDFDEDWYPIDDPRNKMNVRKRDGFEVSNAPSDNA